MTVRLVDGVRVVVATAATPLGTAALTPAEAARLGQLTAPHRRQQWLMSRRAMREALEATGRSADTADYAFPHSRVSLSHSRRSAVAVAVDGEPDEVVGVGIDIEPVRFVRPGTMRFFLTEPEREWLAAVSDDRRAVEHIRLWTVKEALFKSDPGNAASRLIHYELDDPAALAGRARRRDAGAIVFRYASTHHSDGLESIALALRGEV